jgi:hypothetical protein
VRLHVLPQNEEAPSVDETPRASMCVRNTPWQGQQKKDFNDHAYHNSATVSP